MTPYNQVLVELFARQASRGMKLGLDRVRALLDGLGAPDAAYPSIIIAGTNGKGSTSAFTAQLLRSSGKRVAHYTSPHLVRFTERIRVDGAEIARDDVERLYHRVLDASDVLGLEPTFFELATVMALLHFKEQRADVAVLEVGLGGRLDATNATEPVVTGITPIDLDHMALLGNTHALIAAEKAGVMRSGKPAWSSVQRDDVALVLREHAARVGAPLRFLSTEDAVTAPLGLRGPHQRMNAALAVKLVESFGVTPNLDALKDTRWPGRLEWIGRVLLDGAHNPHGVRALGAALQGEPDVVSAPTTVWLLAASGDRDAGAMARELLSAGAREPDLIVATQASVGTAVPAWKVEDQLVEAGFRDVSAHENIAKAVALATSSAGQGVVIAFGSLYAVGAIRAHLTGEAMDVVALSG